MQHLYIDSSVHAGISSTLTGQHWQFQFPSLNWYNLWAWCRKQFASVTCPLVRTWPTRQNLSSEIGQSSFYLVPNHEEGHIPMSQVIEQHKLCLSKSLDQRIHHSRNMSEHCQHSLAASWPAYQDAAQLQKNKYILKYSKCSFKWRRFLLLQEPSHRRKLNIS